MFVDKVKIYVKAGNGGNGCCSFRREKFVPKGGPDGGDGGKGGDVILRADLSEQNLTNLKYQQHCKAKNGMFGMGKNRHGIDGEDNIIFVPPGTIVMDPDRDMEVIADLYESGVEFIAGTGGSGGKGNSRFATSTNRAPRYCEEGKHTDEKIYILELKTIADIGLVGYPNAGKSTFLNAVSDAHPKTASYPFTTIYPHVGVLEFDDFSKITIADIPGLVEGASENIGLGHDFLRHIERTAVIVFVLDMASTDNRCPVEDYKSLVKELDLYLPELSERGKVIFANKMDMDIATENLKLLKKETKLPIIEMSAEIEENTEKAIDFLRDAVKKFGKPKTLKKRENTISVSVSLSELDDDF